MTRLFLRRHAARLCGIGLRLRVLHRNRLLVALAALLLGCSGCAGDDPAQPTPPAPWACTTISATGFESCTCSRAGAGLAACPVSVSYACCKLAGDMCTCTSGTTAHCETVLEGTDVGRCPP